MKTKYFLIFIIILFSSNAYSTNIRVIEFQKIIENNINISNLYDQINKDQLDHKVNFKNEELNLQNDLDRIEKLKLILDPNELENEIESYNNKLNIFNNKIQNFNLHYEAQINNLKNKIIDIIFDELKKYSKDNNIDLILDSNNYILSNNSINITKLIEEQTNKKKIEINFEKY